MTSLQPLAQPIMTSSLLQTLSTTTLALSCRSRVYLISGEQEREQQLITEGRVEKEICTGSQLETVAGLRLCASLAYPNATLQESAPWYPLTGPLTAEIALEKVDDFSAYEFEASFIRDQVSWWRNNMPGDVMESLSASLALCEGNRQVTGGFPS